MSARPRYAARFRRYLKPSDALLVGRLSLNFDRGTADRPGRFYLTIDVWCPYCKRQHNHGWVHQPPFRSDAVQHRVAHCSQGSPLVTDEGYYVGLDPEEVEHNRAIVKECEEANAKRKHRPLILSAEKEASA
jgi:hypothetical protein